MRFAEHTNQSDPVDAGILIPQFNIRYQMSYSTSFQYGSNRLIASTLPRAAATGASMPCPLWHQITRPSWSRASSQAHESGG